MNWRDWPAKRIPARAAVASVIILFSIATLTAIDWLYGLIGAVVLLSSSAAVLLPTRYELSDQGVTVLNPLRYLKAPWDRFRSWHHTEGGVYLRAHSKFGWLARRRSVYLPTTDIAAVSEFLAGYLGEAANEARA